MLRMETEILGLRTRLKNENDARSRAEKREAVLSDKVNFLCAFIRFKFFILGL